MIKGVEIWDLEGDFWKANPFFKIPSEFQKLYKEDKSKDKRDSSQIMWALALYTDFGSKFKQLTEDERKSLIEKDFLKRPFDWSKVQVLINQWNVFKTPIQKQMDQWERLMNEKNDCLKTLKYTVDTAEDIEKLLLSNEKLYKAYESINSKLAEEGSSGTAQGGSLESLSETGEI